MSGELALNGELSKLNREKQDLCDIATKMVRRQDQRDHTDGRFKLGYKPPACA